MLKEYVDMCVGCPPEMGCLGDSCPQRNSLVFKCDNCESEDEIYEFEGQELCIECIKELLEKVK